jgi:hypothetical protein
MDWICDFEIEGKTLSLIKNEYENTGRISFDIVEMWNPKTPTIAALSVNRFNIGLGPRQFLVPESRWPKIKPYFDKLQHIFEDTKQRIKTPRDGVLRIFKEKNHGLLKCSVNDVDFDGLVNIGMAVDNGDTPEKKRRKIEQGD